MATVAPFRALRPIPEHASRVAAVPYDVVSVEEARALASGEPFSFLHVSRAEIDLPDGDPYADAVYGAAAEAFARLKRDVPMVRDEAPALYLYRLTLGAQVQVGVAGCFSLEEYDADVIHKHERTRPTKEDDRTRHLVTLRAQTGPVFLAFRHSHAVASIMEEGLAGDPLFDFEAADGVRHTVWRLDDTLPRRLVAAFRDVPALYIADGHHRAASAARARTSLGTAEAKTFLAVAFPDDQVRILAYNRAVADLNGLDPAAFLDRLGASFEVAPGPAIPAARGEIAMYLAGTWYGLRERAVIDRTSRERNAVTDRTSRNDAVRSLDVSVLQERVLDPILGVRDVRTDPRIEFVGGARGTQALEARVDAGRAAVAFSLFPVSVGELMAVSDAGDIMPPKSTWFEPKLRDGLLIHEL